MHDYGVIILSEPLIFLGFSRLLEVDLMGVIWREEHQKSIEINRHKIENPCFSCKIRLCNCFYVAIYH